MMVRYGVLLLAATAAAAQVPCLSINGSVCIDVNVQILSKATVKAKYSIRMPKGITVGSVVAENKSQSTIIVGQGSIIAALRNNQYPALSRNDAAAVILHAQQGGVLGSLLTALPIFSKLSADTEHLIVAGAIRVSPGVGAVIAGVSAAIGIMSPDLVGQLRQFEQTYDSDGLQNLLQLGPGQSAEGKVIFDAPGKGVPVVPKSFQVSVPAAVVTPVVPAVSPRQ